MCRWDKALQQLRKLKFTPATAGMKARAITIKNLAGALYGTEAGEATCYRIKQLTADIIDVFRSRNDHHVTGWFFSNFLTDKVDLDPIVQIFTRRVLQLRRTTCKKPHRIPRFARVLETYAGEGGQDPKVVP